MQHDARARRRVGATIAIAVTCALLPSAVGAYDWLQFNGSGAHDGNNTQETTITAANVSGMQRLCHPSRTPRTPVTRTPPPPLTRIASSSTPTDWMASSTSISFPPARK
ncbi:MAG: hypothetical protein LC748_16885 [Thermomicrobia bacterium]|nr:hypothetical protein [Thermomicrobia bacterium]